MSLFNREFYGLFKKEDYMKHQRTILSIILLTILLSLSLAACGQKSDSAPAPFSELTWDSSYDDMIALEGKEINSYDSIYNGTTYAYNRSFLDHDGSIKYMYDDKEKLVCIAWEYTAKSPEDLKEVYDEIVKDLTKKYGDSEYQSGNSTNNGNVWYRKEGNIILSSVSTKNINAILYSHLSPSVSSPEND